MLVNSSKQTKNMKQNELNQKNYSKTSNNRKLILSNQGSQKFNTDVLDDAMQELLDICQQYNDKLTMNEKSNERKDNSSQNSRNNPSGGNDNKPTMTNDSDSKHSGMHSYSRESKMQKPEMTASSDNMWLPSGSIERLQQRQSTLQSQLDEVLKAAKSLSIKQKRKLKCILEDDNDELMKDDVSSKGEDAEDEENELLEFQQIENELRISDLNRQLDAIQEELRIRLFKRLVSNTNNRRKPLQHDQTVQQQQQHQHTGDPNAHANDSSPSSSSCSDELTTTSNSDVSHSANDKASTKVEDLHQQQMISTQRTKDSIDEPDAHVGEHKRQDEITKEPGDRSHREIAGTVNANNDFLSNFNVDQSISGATSKDSSTSSTTPTNNQSDLDSALDNMRGNEMMTPTTSKESLGSSGKRGSPTDANNLYSNMGGPYHSTHHQSNVQSYYPFSYYQINPNGQMYPSSGTLRNNSANSDLERIEEDEEDCQDYYSNSNHFRTIYEEKLSPIMQGTRKSGSNQQHDTINAHDSPRQASKPTEIEDFREGGCQKVTPSDLCYNNTQPQQHVNQRYNPSSGTSFDRSTESSNYNNNSFSASGCSGSSASSSKRNTTSRPLTLYLPRPDEEIDLVEHIQALGHDLNIISNDLRLNSTSAHGFLWKSCSNNNKKWLKRYFYFDRNLKVLSYYENENQLVKKHSKPKISIRFEEISDVYVDHKLSGIGERDRSSKRKNYVFVLATIGRKYLLASSRVETMRAWIDILFTAAKANDYFQQLGTIEGVDDVAEDGNLFMQPDDIQ